MKTEAQILQRINAVATERAGIYRAVEGRFVTKAQERRLADLALEYDRLYEDLRRVRAQGVRPGVQRAAARTDVMAQSLAANRSGRGGVIGRLRSGGIRRPKRLPMALSASPRVSQRTGGQP